MARSPRARFGCQSCRLKHLKCDDAYPSCGRCRKAGFECVRDLLNVRFRHEGSFSVHNLSAGVQSNYKLTSEQHWLKIPETLTFVDETQDVMIDYDHQGGVPSEDYEMLRATPSLLEKPSTELNSNQRVDGIDMSDLVSTEKQPNSLLQSQHELLRTSMTSHESMKPTSSNVWDIDRSNEMWPATTTFNESHRNASSSKDTQNAIHPPDNLSTYPKIYLTEPAWPLHSNEEARLIRYFVEHVAESFDVMDKLRHFTHVVPQRASICPILLNAMYAASAKHLARLAGHRNLVSCGYSAFCLEQLIPILGDSVAIMDENLLAAIVILRFLESLEVPLSGNDLQNHLLGTQVFISAQRNSAFSGTLREAAFWVGLRQDIYVAFVNQRPIAQAFENIDIDRSLEPADDFVWANRMVVHCADVISFCFGDGPDHGTAKFNALFDYGQQWVQARPSSFDPIFYQEAEPEMVFPQVWMLGQHTVVAMQHYHLSLILLAAHNPKLPRLGPGRKGALEKMDVEIKTSIKALCGMAVSNYKYLMSWITACQGIAMCGERFTERNEQEALLGILSITEKTHGWPTGSVVRTLKAGWGWPYV